MLGYLIWAVIIIVIVKYARTAKSRGRRGENKVKRIIGKTKENEKYVINNLILENEGMTSQIDHIVINSRGVFVIETKNYAGEIYGSESQHEWTQVLAYGKVKNKFRNPLKQNATHIYNVRKIIGNFHIRSLVVFVQNNAYNIESKDVIPIVCLRKELECGEDVLSNEQMKQAYEMLLANKKNVTNRQHIRNIKKQQINLESGICPRCGAELALRDGKYGKFLGCSNYPKCKFVKKL